MRKVLVVRVVLVLVLSLAVAYLVGCRDALPSAPSDLANGVIIYEHANFLGRSGHISSDVRDLKDVDGPCEHEQTNWDGLSSSIWDWNDCLSSIRIAPGWRGTIYRDSNFHGQSLQITEDVPNLQLVPGSCDHDGMNDCVTSIKVFPP